MDAVGRVRRNPVVVAVGSRINNAKLEGTKVINARHGRSGRSEGHRAVRATRPSARWEGDIGVDAVGRRNPVVVAVGSRINNAKLEGTKVINARHGRSGRSERSTVETTGRRIALEVGLNLNASINSHIL